MIFENLHTIIDRYENDLDNLSGELFKWRSTKAWQDAFHSSEGTGTFRDRFASAKKQFSFFMDNGFQHPSTGIMKLWEKEPETMEHLVMEVLLFDASGDAAKAEANMQSFLNGYESLRAKYYPAARSYKIDPHIASVLMIMDKPELHYVFRISAAKRLASYIGFEDDLGSGEKPNLVNYYRLCDQIVSILKEHESLLQKHYLRLDDQMYKDRELHLMVFDLMHCSGYRGYYTGLVSSTIGKAKKRKQYAGPSAEELAKKEQERLAQIELLERQINELEISIEDFEEISLLGVAVSFPDYGIGTVIDQNISKITVQFPETKRDFVLNKAYTKRPRFENDDEIVEAFSAYDQTKSEIEKLKKKLKPLLDE